MVAPKKWRQFDGVDVAWIKRRTIRGCPRLLHRDRTAASAHNTVGRTAPSRRM